MKIFLTGGTGVIGTRALPALVAAGHDVTAVARGDEKAALVERLGGTPVRVDLFDATAVKSAVDGHEAVVHLATNIPPMSKAVRGSAWETNERLRSEASTNLVEAALATGAQHYVQESICFPYRDSGADWVTEDTPLEYPGRYAAAQVAEDNALRFGVDGRSGVVLRFAQFYSPDSAHVQTFDSMLRKRVNPFIGKAEAYVSFIHAVDAGSSVVFALGAPTGIYNVGDDEPMTRVDAGAAAAEALGLKPPRRIPGSGVKMGSTEMLARSVRVSNAKLKETTGWAPQYPSIREGWGRSGREVASGAQTQGGDACEPTEAEQ